MIKQAMSAERYEQRIATLEKQVSVLMTRVDGQGKRLDTYADDTMEFLKRMEVSLDARVLLADYQARLSLLSGSECRSQSSRRS